VRIKLDEYLGRQPVELLRQAGHDVETVGDERLCGTADDDLIEVCGREGSLVGAKAGSAACRRSESKHASFLVLRFRMMTDPSGTFLAS
jgi:hypothetical protein